MTSRQWPARVVWVGLLIAETIAPGRAFCAAAGIEPGLRVTFTVFAGDSPRITDIAVLPNVWLYVPAGEPPTPFLPGGKFMAVWEGFISSELRDHYTFQAELNGTVKLEIRDTVVWEGGSAGGAIEPGKPVRLNKGTNAFKVTYTSPAKGDAFLRLSWSSSEFAFEPVASSALRHDAGSAGLLHARNVRHGRELFVEFRCVRCHTISGGKRGMPELAMDAPTFEGIGERRNEDWLARWVEDPGAQRPTARMPALLRGPEVKDDAGAIAAFLATLKGVSAAAKAEESRAGQMEAGRRLFATLHCAACHNPPETGEDDATKIPLKDVRAKFADGRLAAFLRKPEEHFVWIRMPNFRLTAEEADHLAAYLNSRADQPANPLNPFDPARIQRGRALVQGKGCLNCHTLELENRFTVKSLADLPPERWNHGCLAEKPADGSKAPGFRFTEAERAALQAFAATDRASLTRHVPSEFAERHARLLHCRECHGKFEGVPAFEVLGAKLKPEWMARFLAGEVVYKPRPWLEGRMPVYPKYAEALATGLAMLHGLPPQTPAEPPVDQTAARFGRRLVSIDGGFSCIACHGVGNLAATQVFEAPGLNFVHSGERLQKSYFHRWLRSPLRVEPTTRMPVYFDNEGKSPLTEIYEGDGAKQIEAIWQYLRLGQQMPSPAGAQ